MSRKKKHRGLLFYIGLGIWATAAIVWLIAGLKMMHRPTEPATDPLHVTGSRKPIPARVQDEQPTLATRIPAGAPKIAIIIDDFGPPWKKEVVNQFIALPYDITLSIIPGNQTSKEVARRAAAAGKETFIHLPLQPLEPIALNEPDMVKIGDSPEKLHIILDRAVAENPGAVGLNNHMGSKATADVTLMRELAAELKTHRLSFIDSRTIENSVALKTMRETGVPSLGRDIFLDIIPDSAAVAAQLEELANIAQKRGWAIGIGHVKRNTLAAIAAALPRLEKEGFQFVSAGKLIRELNSEQMATTTK